MTPAQLRDALPRLYGTLLARFGRPTPIQLDAAAPILAGRDVLLCAPTASGKTEGWLGPLGERHLATSDGPRILVVSPTRALVNDLHRRLLPRLQAAGIPVARWTGDHHDGLLAVTILTPEGLDSRLSRDPGSLRGLAAVVVDEVHVLDGTARGDQLRVLLARLRAERDLQVVAASATVADPEAVAARYLREAVVVRAGERRRIHAKIVRVGGPGSVGDALSAATSGGLRKALLFCNARNDVERIARRLRGRPPFGDGVFAHHGSLARAERLRVEARFLAAPAALCVCTSTLEMGVDIGDVDLVALLGLPPSAASLVQRVGRGGRRTEGSNVLALAESPFEEVAFRTLLRASARGDFLEPPYGFRPGVLVQQAVSVLHERASRTVDGAALHRRLPADLAAAWTPARLERVLAHAAEGGWLARVRGAWGIGPKAEAAWSRGVLHGNLGDRAGVSVVDALTGEEVGQVAADDAPSVALGGTERRRLRGDGERIVTERGATMAESRFESLPAAPVSAAMARELLAGMGIPAPCRVDLGGRTLFHGLGTAAGKVLAGCFPGKSVHGVGALALVFAGEWPDQWPAAAAAEAAARRLHHSLARSLAMGRHHRRLLPEDEQAAAVAALCELPEVERVLARGIPDLVPAADADAWSAAAAW